MAKLELYALEVTLKSGAKVEVDVLGATYTSGPGKKLEWTTPDNWTEKMLHIDMDEVAAIVVCKK